MLKPQRVVCMTAETVEIAFRVGAGDRVAGVTGYAVRPPEARQKPKVAAFQTAHVDRILELKPDLVLGFSDLQADIAAELVRRGVEVHVFNQRGVDDILLVIRRLGRLVDRAADADALADELAEGLETIRREAEGFARRPRVFFEEWDDPLISGIRWVAELVRIAGGDDCFPELAAEPLARDRIIADPQRVVERAPDIIVGSWCGKKFRPEKVAARPGWDRVPAVRTGALHEVKSAQILQPGPAALSDGVRALHRIFREWQS